MDIKLEPFVSSIKIKGLFFLPPVITANRRIELQKYKQQAVKLEKRLQTCRDLRRSLQDLLQQKTISDHSQSSEAESIMNTESFSKYVECDFPLFRKRTPTLSCDVIDVTEYGQEGIKIIDNREATEESEVGNKVIEFHGTKGINTVENERSIQESKMSSDVIELNNDKTQEVVNENCNPNSEQIRQISTPTDNYYEDILESIESNLIGLQSFIDHLPNSSCSTSQISSNKDSSPPPRLIRSNSYILENPSPILLANMDKFCVNEPNEGLALNQAESNRSSLESGYIPFEKSGYNSLVNGYDKSPTKEQENKVEVIQTNISVQHITFDCDKNMCEETETQKSSLEFVDPNHQLLEVLKSIPEDYSQKIIDLIEKQQIEHCNNKINGDNHLNYNNTNGDFNTDQLLDHQEEPTWSNTISEVNLLSEQQRSEFDKLSGSPSQSLYYTLSSGCTILPTSPSIHIMDLECDDPTSEKVENGISEPAMIHDSENHKRMDVCRKKLSFRRDRVKQLNDEITTIKQEWAASVIGAHVKGYLTRRLLKTERVQSLLSTITDALNCAFQLHGATPDSIDQADVELHRRLINQVNAACYAFHDIFFTLSIPEQMSIIATDRRRKLEKLRRPASAPAPRRTRSASKLKPRTSLSQSMTKV